MTIEEYHKITILNLDPNKPISFTRYGGQRMLLHKSNYCFTYPYGAKGSIRFEEVVFVESEYKDYLEKLNVKYITKII